MVHSPLPLPLKKEGNGQHARLQIPECKLVVIKKSEMERLTADCELSSKLDRKITRISEIGMLN